MAENREPTSQIESPLVSIIVLNYNGKRYLKNCFESVRKINYPNFETVMVDNNSTDDSVEYVKKYFPWVHVIEADENKGFAAGNNIGIGETKGKYVFLLNNDTICTPDFLSKVVKVAESDPNIGVVGACPLNSRYIDYEIDMPWELVIDSSAVAGAAMLIRRDTLNEVGLLDENYFLYWEDTEFCWRMNLYGYRVVTVYDAIVYHLLGATGLPGKKWVFEMTKNKIYTHLKLMNMLYVCVALVDELIRSMARIIIRPAVSKSVLKGWLWNIKNLGTTLEKRRGIRSRKKIKDWNLIRLIIDHNRRYRRDLKYLEKMVKRSG